MKPFEELYSEHYQWRTWTDGQTQVHVTLAIFPENGQNPVGEKSMYRRVFKDGKITWTLVSSSCLIFTPGPKKK